MSKKKQSDLVITTTKEEDQTVLYVLGAIADLGKLGLVNTRGQSKATPKGIAAYDQIKASGWKPNPIELRSLLRYLAVRKNMISLDEIEYIAFMVEHVDHAMKCFEEHEEMNDE